MGYIHLSVKNEIWKQSRFTNPNFYKKDSYQVKKQEEILTYQVDKAMVTI